MRGTSLFSLVPSIENSCKQYERHARDVDAACCGVPRGAGDGPVLQRLRELGPVHGLVVDAFGEASADVHSLLAMCAGSGLYLRWHGAMARGPGVYRSQLIVQLHRVWGAFRARQRAAQARAHTQRPRPRPTHCCRPRRVLAHDTRASRRRQQLPRAVRLPLRRTHQRPLRRLKVNGVFAHPATGAHPHYTLTPAAAYA